MAAALTLLGGLTVTAILFGFDAFKSRVRKHKV